MYHFCVEYIQMHAIIHDTTKWKPYICIRCLNKYLIIIMWSMYNINIY